MSTKSNPGLSRMYRHLYFLLKEVIKKIRVIDFPYMPDVMKTPTPAWQPTRKRIRFPNNKKAPYPIQKDILHRF
ncbi:MAG: hypothetical protein WCH59_10125 [Chitinophagia bacterium]|jgi:hypothetical protein